MNHESDVMELAAIMDRIFPYEAWDDGVENTARRVLRMWQVLGTRAYEAEPNNMTVFPSNKNQIILAKDIHFSSWCAHHLLPFYGIAHVAYIPHKLQIGISKLPRIVEFYSEQPQVQERLTNDILSFVKKILEPKGVAVVMNATHTCMSCRGIKATGASMTTSLVDGVFLTASAARNELLALIHQ